MDQDMKITPFALNQFFQHASIGTRIVDKEFNILGVNQTFSSMIDMDPEAIVGRKCYDVLACNLCHTQKCPLVDVLNGMHKSEHYISNQRPDGSVRHYLLTATPFLTEEESIGIFESFKDTTDVEHAKALARVEREKLQRILSHLVEGVCIINKDYQIEYQTEVSQRYFDNCVGEHCYTAMKQAGIPCEKCVMHQAIRKKTSQSGEFVTSRQQIFEAIYNPFTDLDGKQKVIVLFRDVTGKKEEMAIAARTEQLATLGELVAGIAHEINNPINGIINYAQVLIDISEKRIQTGDIADRIRKEGDRIAEIVDVLLSFARRNKQGKVYVSLRNIISDSLTLTAATLRKDSILVKTNVQDDLPQIMAYPQEIEQVFINLIANARHALNKKFRRPNEFKVFEITAETRVSEGQPFIRISFRDNGIGIPGNMIDKIWKPFFTNKEESKRTGLGLSISQNIVAGHGGKLVVESEEGAYTVVHVDLPLL